MDPAQVTKLISHVQQHHIVMEARYGVIAPDSPLLEVIGKLDPYTISWSNLLDYCRSYSDFHKMARACSGPNTVHFAYSMNWTRSTKGANYIDYPLAVRKKLLEQAKAMYVFTLDTIGARTYFRCPPVENPINIVSNFSAPLA